MRSTFSPRVAPIAAFMLIGTAVLFAAWAGIARGGGDPATDPAAQRAAIQSKAPDLVNLVTAFRRDQSDSDRIPGDPLGDLKATGTLQAGEDPRLSRRLALESSPVYVWPADERVCYSVKNAGGCVPTDALRRHGVLMTSIFQSDNPAVTLFGFVAPGVRRVVVTLDDGTTIAPPVTDDAFTVSVATEPVKVTWANPDGSAGLQAPVVVRGASG